MGLIAYIFKNKGRDCSNSGLSSFVDQVCLTNVEGPFEPSDDCPAALLLPGNLKGTVKVVPDGMGGRSVMFGGCYVATSDSRFSEAIEAIIGARFYGAVAFHDRVE